MPTQISTEIKDALINRAESTEWEAIVKYNGDIQAVASALDVHAEDLGDGFAILTLPAERVHELYDFKEIEYIELPKNLTLMLHESMSAVCVTPVHRQEQGSYSLTGEGVLIGIIDSGIDYTHPDFRDESGKSRVLFLWDQTKPGNPPDGFLNGTEYSNEQLNAMIKKPRPGAGFEADFAGHGTSVAGIAAGNGRASGGVERGVAPKASLIAVKLGQTGRESFARSTEIMRALRYIIDKARSLDMPVAVNLSFGTNNGSHMGDTLFENYLDLASQHWKTVVVVAAGNEGSAGHHFSGRLKHNETRNAEFTVATNKRSLYLTLWKSFADDFELEIISPSGRSSGILNPNIAFQRLQLDGAGLKISYGQPSYYNGHQEIFIKFTSDQPIPTGVWTVRVRGREIIDGKFHIWLPTLEEVGEDTAFLSPEPNNSITLPATAKNVISVGGYNPVLNSAADFSGRGEHGYPHAKPDLAAPAVNILSTRVGGGYDSFTGTSMAAPFVTGAAAIMMQWGIVQGNDPFLYGQRVKAYLQKSANRDPERAYPSAIWGYGTLCLKAAIDALRAYKL